MVPDDRKRDLVETNKHFNYVFNLCPKRTARSVKGKTREEKKVRLHTYIRRVHKSRDWNSIFLSPSRAKGFAAFGIRYFPRGLLTTL